MGVSDGSVSVVPGIGGGDSSSPSSPSLHETVSRNSCGFGCFAVAYLEKTPLSE